MSETVNVLVIGSGGREHTLAWALARSPTVAQVYVAPGNAGTEWPAEMQSGRAPSTNVPIAADDVKALITFAHDPPSGRIDLTVVGPEGPLAAGIVDAFEDAGLRIFGPRREAAQIEASKAFAKDFMRECGIPTGDYVSFTEYAAARAYLQEDDGPVVVKASGLAAGKGVIVCDTRDEARAALHKIMVERAFGDAGETVLIEERLTGPELSVLAFSDGKTVIPMPPARDHKRVYDNDEGPNTGGMGAYAPAPDVGESLVRDVQRTILQPAIDGMAARGTPYAGVLYAGLMLTEDGPRVLEFNCRFGDPEAQVIVPLLASDLAEVLLACVEGRLDQVDVLWRPAVCATVIMASPGYPGSYPTGRTISGTDEVTALDDVMVFHAGTACRGERLVTAGGRVLAVSALGETLKTALQRAYDGVERIHFDGAHYRRDIGIV